MDFGHEEVWVGQRRLAVGGKWKTVGDSIELPGEAGSPAKD
jgi:hypothetical protein